MTAHSENSLTVPVYRAGEVVRIVVYVRYAGRILHLNSEVE